MVHSINAIKTTQVTSQKAGFLHEQEGLDALVSCIMHAHSVVDTGICWQRIFFSLLSIHWGNEASLFLYCLKVALCIGKPGRVMEWEEELPGPGGDAGL